MKLLGPLLFIVCLSCLSGCSSASKGQMGGIQPGMTKSGVIIEAGRPVENWGRGEKDYWSYADSEGKKCKVRFEEGRVSKDEIKCEEAGVERAPAYIDAAQKYDQVGKYDTHEQRVRRFCGVQPEPRYGCVIGECVDGIWQETCGGAPPSPSAR